MSTSARLHLPFCMAPGRLHSSVRSTKEMCGLLAAHVANAVWTRECKFEQRVLPVSPEVTFSSTLSRGLVPPPSSGKCGRSVSQKVGSRAYVMPIPRPRRSAGFVVAPHRITICERCGRDDGPVQSREVSDESIAGLYAKPA